MSENIRPGTIVKTDDGRIGIFETMQDNQYVIRYKNEIYKANAIKRATCSEVENLCIKLLKEPQ